jgi:5'-3' exonuclease
VRNHHNKKNVTKTLLIDGSNLFKIGFYGVKEFYHDGKHIGGIYHFINTIRRFLSEYNYDKVIVFWDGDNNSSQRKLIFPQYKENRLQTLNEFKRESFEWQVQRVKSYLEEMFVRQVCIDDTESDDLIAHYCHISKGEKKTIFSSDKDLTQLISDDVEVYQPIKKIILKNGDLIPLKEISIPHQNIATFKIISGDKSDNIDGIQYMGEKTFVKLFPEIIDNIVSVDDIFNRAEELHKTDKDNRALQNLLSGKTRRGIFGQEFFDINKKLVDLSNPILSDDAKGIIELYYHEELDPDGRGYKNLMRMMMTDGIFKYLPKYDNAWVDFLTPFMKLTRKEKRRFKNNKKK